MTTLPAAITAAALPFPPGVAAGVHPCRGKAALVPGWPDAATTDAETIRMWWCTYPAANPAIAIRAGLAVLDVDPRHGGTESLATLEAECGPLPASWRVATGGGGVHVYFTIPAGLPLKNRAGALGPGLDLKTAGGYVLAPGAIHPDTGQPYRWQPGYAPEDGPIAIMPWPLIAKLIAPASPATSKILEVQPTSTASTSWSPPTNGERWSAEDILERYLRQARNGNRNDVGYRLFQQAHWNGYDRAEVEDLARAYVDRVDQSGEPYTLSEALDSVDQAFKSKPGEPWGRPPQRGISGQAAEPIPGDCDDLRTAIAALRAENAALKRENARLTEVGDFQSGVITEQRRELDELRGLQRAANAILSVPDQRHAVTKAKVSFLYEIAAARQRKQSHPDHPNHYLVYSAAAEAGSGSTRRTVHTAKQELIAAGIVSQVEEFVRDPETGEARRYCYYDLAAGADLTASVQAAAEAAQAALEDKPERKPRVRATRCIHCGQPLICATCGCAQVDRGDVQNLHVGHHVPSPSQHAEDDLTAQILHVATEPVAPAPVNTNGNGHKPPPTPDEIAFHRALLGGRTLADMTPAERAASFRGGSPPT